MNFEVKIDGDILKAKIGGHHTIWMCRAPRGVSIKTKSGIYILTDNRGYCCYVGQTNNFRSRMATHASNDKFFWWTHTIYFWDGTDDDKLDAFASTGQRQWYEKKMKEAIELKHPTFTEKVQKEPKPPSGDEVLGEMLDLLDVIDFATDKKLPSPGLGHPVASSRPTPTKKSSSKASRAEPSPPKNHRPPLGSWPSHTALAKAIAVKNGNPKADGGILHKLTNFWESGRNRYTKASPKTRKMLESFGVEFDSDGFVKSCACVPYPL